MTNRRGKLAPIGDLAGRLVELCGHVCLTGEEDPLADELEATYADAGEPTTRVANSVVVGTPGQRPMVVLVGHIDVVPATDRDRDPRVTAAADHEPARDSGVDGNVVVGRGTSDMKGGVAVAESLYRDQRLRDAADYDLALVLYGGEEGSADTNELPAVLDEVGWLSTAALAIVLEPTDLDIHAGCLGGLQAELTFTGRQSHSARPWQGANALTAAGELLVDLGGVSPTAVTVDGITYHDTLTATQAWTGNPKNVVPGYATVNVNYRFAPDRTLDQAERELADWVDGRAEIAIVDRVPPAPPALDEPTVAAFVEQSEAPITAKQAWTDVARLAAAGVPALNYGPGCTSQAHQAGEFVPVANLAHARDTIANFMTG